MSSPVDQITQRPVGQWRLSPPEVVVASNGFVLRTYDVFNDSFRYAIAATAEEVAIELRKWADGVAEDLRRATEREIAKATGA